MASVGDLQNQLQKEKDEKEQLKRKVDELHSLLQQFLAQVKAGKGASDLEALLPSAQASSSSASASSSSSSTSTSSLSSAPSSLSSAPSGAHRNREEEEKEKDRLKAEEEKRLAEEEAQEVTKVTKRGEWSIEKRSAGGCFNTNQWRQNPQYFININGHTKVEIVLEQLCAKEEDCKAIGFYLLKSDGTNRKVISTPTKFIVAKTTFINKPHIALTLELETGAEEGPGQFTIIPCTFEPNMEAKFALTVTSHGKPFTLQSCSNPAKKWTSEISFKGEWKGDLAGGCKNHRTFYNNPQYLLSVKEDNTAVSILLEKINKNPDFDVLGLYICEVDGPVDKKVVSVAATVARTPLSSPDDASVAATLDAGDYVVFPCTFDPKWESEFALSVYSSQNISFRELGATSSISVDGVWKGESAGGCMNHTTWRNNPQFFLTVKEKTSVTIKMRHDLTPSNSIGFYILSSVNGGRPLLAKKEVLVAKSGFWEAPEVSKSFDLEARKDPYVIVPCTFTPDVEAPFNLSFYPSKGAESIEIRAADDVLQKHVDYGEWKGLTAGGCLNYGMWRNNPQYRITAKQSEKLTLFLGQYLGENKSIAPKSIGFYIYESANPGQRLTSTKGLDLLCKGKFRKQKEVNAEFEVQGGKEYVVIPTTFRPNQEAQFDLTVFSRLADNIALSPLHDSAENLVFGVWGEGTSGGCMNHPTFMENPHFSLAADKECEVTLLLVQEQPADDLPYPAIGCYVTKGNEWGFPVVEAEGDIIKKTAFENGQDIELALRVGPDSHPWIVTPCTYEMGVKSSFYMRLFVKPADRAHVRFQEVDYAPYIRHLNGEAEPEPQQAAEAPKPAQPEAQPEPETAPAAPTPEPPKPAAVAVAEAPAAPAAPEKKKKKEKKEKKTKKEKKPSGPVKKCPEEVKCPGCGMVFDPFNLMVIAHPAKPIVASAPPPPQQPSKAPAAPKPAPPSPAPPPPAALVATEEEPMYNSLLSSLGMAKLKAAKDRVLPPPPPTKSFLPFNMEKIVARRAAIEGDSDDEEEELDDEWLAD